MPATGDVLLRLRGFDLARRTADGERPLLDGIDLDVRAGRWLAVLGANGSGKSSLLKYLASEDSPLADSAAIVFQDPDDQIIAATVEQELALGRSAAAAVGLATRYGLDGLEAMPPQVLSAGQKQRLALAAATAREPALLLCDEPTALQDREQAAWVLDRLDEWRREPGRALVTATCDRSELERADEVIVLRDGRIALAGGAAELSGHKLVEELLGEPEVRAQARGRGGASAADEAVLRLEGVACRFTGPGGGFGPVDLRLGAGERVGLTGPNGCGKSTLLGVCAGVRPPESGTVRLGVRRLYARGRRDLDHGLALLAPQFPEYLFTRTSVAAEIDMDPALAGCGHEALLADLGLPNDVLARNPHDLSTGQKRRLALGLVILSQRPLVLLDEPTAALDRAGRRRVLDLLERLPRETALLAASHDRDFLAAAGCRILEMAPEGLIPAENGDSG